MIHIPKQTAHTRTHTYAYAYTSKPERNKSEDIKNGGKHKDIEKRK